jgi:hypothetical protein
LTGAGDGFDGSWVPMSEAVAGDYDHLGGRPILSAHLPRQARDVIDGSGGSGSSEEDEDNGSDEGAGLLLFR